LYREVTIIRLIAENTVEVDMLQMATKKLELEKKVTANNDFDM
jgi:SNF2 family DNA or RNA helicase